MMRARDASPILRGQLHVNGERRGEKAAPRASEQGFILLSVLWLLVALGAVGLHGSLRMKTERIAAANTLDELRAREAAMAGAEYARARLSAAMLDRADDLRAEAAAAQATALQQAQGLRGQAARQAVTAATRPRTLGQLFRQSDPSEDPWRDPEGLVVRDGGLVEAGWDLTLRDPGAAVHLNVADDLSLQAFFANGLGLDAALADQLAQAILDWRDEDDLPRILGAERDAYLAEGAAVLPANRPFREVGELRHVLGMTDEIFQRAEPYLTLVGSGRINLNAAPRPVLLSIPGMTEAGADEFIRLREAGTLPRALGELRQAIPQDVIANLTAFGGLGQRVAFQTNEVEILSRGWSRSGGVEVMVRMVVARSDDGALVLWRELDG
jgi:type II secretory pathway component PulK